MTVATETVTIGTATLDVVRLKCETLVHSLAGETLSCLELKKTVRNKPFPRSKISHGHVVAAARCTGIEYAQQSDEFFRT